MSYKENLVRVLNENPERVIDWFDDFADDNDYRNQYAFMSNFYERPVHYGGHEFPTSEHAFAHAKVDPYDDMAETWMELIREAADPGTAKVMGRQCPLRADWEIVKFWVMQQIVEAKFRQHADLAAALIATGDAYLQEGTFWSDVVWGVDASRDHEEWWERPGSNWLGVILMSVRARLKAEWAEGVRA